MVILWTLFSEPSYCEANATRWQEARFGHDLAEEEIWIEDGYSGSKQRKTWRKNHPTIIILVILLCSLTFTGGTGALTHTDCAESDSVIVRVPGDRWTDAFGSLAGRPCRSHCLQCGVDGALALPHAYWTGSWSQMVVTKLTIAQQSHILWRFCIE